MAKWALALASLGCLTAAVLTDWRAALLMIVGWWADNILKGIVKHERDHG